MLLSVYLLIRTYVKSYVDYSAVFFPIGLSEATIIKVIISTKSQLYKFKLQL